MFFKMPNIFTLGHFDNKLIVRIKKIKKVDGKNHKTYFTHGIQ